MLLRRNLLFLSALLTTAAGCDNPPVQSERAGFGTFDPDAAPDNTLEDDAGAASNTPEDETDAGSASLTPDPQPELPRPTYGIVSSDYTATSVSLIDQFGELIAEDYINSGFAEAGLTTALSGDVSLPSLSGERGVLVLLDRYKTDVITRLDLSDGSILGQVRTHRAPPAGSTSTYSSNPHDYVYVDAHTAWITRYEPNLDPGVPERDLGTDLVRIDPTTMELTSDRIDLTVLNTRGSRVNPDTKLTEDVDVFARPSRMVRIGNTLLVGLSRLSFDFSAVGTGMVAHVDLGTHSVTGVAIDGLNNCSSVVAVPGNSNRVFVSCAGFWVGDQRATAGIAMLKLSAGEVTVEQVFRASEHADAPMAVNNVVALGGTRVGAVAYGKRARAATASTPAVPGGPDTFAVIDVATGEVTTLFETASVYAIGQGNYDAKRKLLLVPDASTDDAMKPTAGLRRFSFARGEAEELTLVSVAPSLSMPVRSINPL